MAAPTTIPEVTPAAKRHTANGATLNFSYNFAIETPGDIIVMMDDTVQTYQTHYWLTGIGSTSGGLVQFTFYPPDGSLITILRAQDIQQAVNLLANSSYSPSTIAAMHNRHTAVDQMLAERISRAITFSPQSSLVNKTIAEPVENYFLVWDAQGNLVNTPGTPSIAGGPLYDFGVTTDGSSDLTTAIQTVWNTSAGLHRVLYMPAGTYMVSALTIPDHLNVVGDGIGRTIIKRLASSSSTTFISASTKSHFSFEGIEFDGNKANQTTGANNIELSTCSDWSIRRCSIKNAYGPAAGAGLYVNGGTNDTEKLQSVVEYNQFFDNERFGLLVNKEWYVKIISNFAKGNGVAGIDIQDITLPSTEHVQNYLTIADNICRDNLHGIGIQGLYESNGISGNLYGQDAVPHKGVVVTGNRCISNTGYGITHHGRGGVVTGNVCERNSLAGIQCGAVNTACNNNTLIDNDDFQIDGGWSICCTFNNNAFYRGGVTGNVAHICLNLGRGDTAVGNTFDDNGTANGGAHIITTGFDLGGDGMAADILGYYNVIANNNILSAHLNMAGITVQRAGDFTVVTGNSVANSSLGYLLGGGADVITRLKESGNVDWQYGHFPVIASDTIVVIPDVGDAFALSGVTQVDTIRTVGMNFYYQTVRSVEITNQGSGYITAPTVGFAGGGGVGAAGTASINGAGKVIGVSITNLGSGYTSAPAVSFTPTNGGIDAAGTALIDCPNNDGRKITFIFTDALTIADNAGNLIMNGNFSADSSSVISFIGIQGQWREISRSINS